MILPSNTDRWSLITGSGHAKGKPMQDYILQLSFIVQSRGHVKNLLQPRILTVSNKKLL